VSKAHWEKKWSNSEVKTGITDHCLATWTPSGTLKDLPRFVRGEGVYLYDEDGKQYIDLTSQAVCVNLGHTPSDSVKEAISQQLNEVPFVYSGLGTCEVRARLSNLMSEVGFFGLSSFVRSFLFFYFFIPPPSLPPIHTPPLIY
jgi:adenosylmethionine-8-amino-7-oxononanoate aminotransferase